MKSLVVFLLLMALTYSSDLISFDTIEQLADRFIGDNFGDYYLDEVVTYYGIGELPGAYAFIYRNGRREPLTIVMGARYTTSPVNEICRALPRSRSVYEEVLDKARSLGYGEPQFQRVYYFGPGQEYCAVRMGDREILINACTFRAIEKSSLFNKEPMSHQELEQATRQKWERYLATTRFQPQDTGYIPEVPFIDWTYGCSPTAFSMILYYWDSHFYNGLTYGRLVDYFFTRWDPPNSEYRQSANVNKELALAMHTDSMSGSTYSSWFVSGLLNVTDTINGYSCSAARYAGYSWNQYQFARIKTEIDAGRPCEWSVYNYWSPAHNDSINHSTTGVGYWIEHPDTFVRVHTTWGLDPEEPLWALWTYHGGVYSEDGVVTFVPGGGNTHNILLSPPAGGTIFKNLKYRIKWTSAGSGIDHLKLWWSYGTQATSYDSANWILIDADVPNTGEYIWTVPDQDSAFRINIVGLSSSNEYLAADGWYFSASCAFPEHTPNLSLVGNFDTEEGATDVVVVDEYAYITDGVNGLLVVDISDSSLPDSVNHLPLPGNSIALSAIPPYLYIADQQDTVRVVSITDPGNPTEVGKCYVEASELTNVFVLDTLLYITCRFSGLKIVKVTSASSPEVIGSYDTEGQAYDVVVVDTIAYVADGIRGLRVLNVADPQGPQEIGFYDTNGITQGVVLDGNRLYLAEGGAGIKVFDVTDPTNPQQLGSLDTPGTAKKVSIYDSLFVADGHEGMRVVDVSDPSSPVEIGYMESFGTATNFAHVRNMLYLADMVDGLYLIHEDITPGTAEMTKENSVAYIMMSSVQRGLLRISMDLNSTENASVAIYDVSGRLVISMHKGNLNPGMHEFIWHPDAAGIYFVRIKTDSDYWARKVVFLK